MLPGIAAACVAGPIDWVPTGAYMGYANTLKVPSYVLFGIEARYEFRVRRDGVP